MIDNPAEKDKPRGNAVAVIAILLALMLPPLYVLSIGPVAMLFRGTPTPPTFIDTFYLPLIYLAQSWEVFGRLMEWYIELWTN